MEVISPSLTIRFDEDLSLSDEERSCSTSERSSYRSEDVSVSENESDEESVEEEPKRIRGKKEKRFSPVDITTDIMEIDDKEDPVDQCNNENYLRFNPLHQENTADHADLESSMPRKKNTKEKRQIYKQQGSISIEYESNFSLVAKPESSSYEISLGDLKDLMNSSQRDFSPEFDCELVSANMNLIYFY